MMKWIFRWVILNIVYVFVGSFACSMEWMKNMGFAIGYYVLLALNVIFLIILFKKGYLRKKIIYALMAIFVILGAISAILAVNMGKAFLGEEGWSEGLPVVAYYFSLMAIGSALDKKHRKKAVIILLIFGAIECAYGVCQAFEMPFVKQARHFIGRVNGKKTYEIWSTGFVGNPNFFSTLALLCLGYAMSLFIDAKSGKKSLIYLILVAIFTCALMVGNTMSCVMGLVAMIVLVLVFVIKNKKFSRFMVVIATMVVASFVIIGFGKTTLVRDINETFFQVSEMTKGNVKENFGTNRIYIWQSTLKEVPKHLWHGVGVDNFCDAFKGDCLRSKDGTKRISKAHNEYLQILITEGIFAALIYLIICGIVVYSGIRDGFKNKTLLFILPVIGYLVQAFFNISVIGVAPLFFLAMGFCINTERKGKILVVGNFGEDGKLDGQTAKTRTVTKTIKKICGEKKVRTIDTKNSGLLDKIKFGLFAMSSDRIVILCAKGSLDTVVKALGFLGCLNNTYYVVIGGWLCDYVSEKPKLTKSLKKMKCVLVETDSLNDKLSELGIETRIIPNYRVYSKKPKLKKKGEKYVFYSRVIKEKGVLIAIDAVRKVGKKKKVYLDIYGPIGEDFKKEFNEKIKDDKYIKYCGILNGDGKILSELAQYKCLLLPTSYDGEGVPGAVIEAMTAGVPTIASNWKYNAEIIKDGETGIILKKNTVAGLANAIEKIENKKIDLKKLSKNCIVESKNYSEEVAMEVLEDVMHE